MQILTARALDAAATEPLLGSRPSGRGSAAAAPAAAAPAAAKRKPPAAGLRFAHHFGALIRLLRPYPALVLTLLAIAEAYVVAEVGKVAGSFYLIVLDGQPARFAAAMAHAAALYGASTTLYAASSYVTEWLALTWRERLTRHLHCCYCQGQHAYYFLQLRQGGKQEQAAAAREQQRLQAGAGERADEEQQPGPAAAAAAVDNPDQRIAADAAELCECLSAVVRVAAAAPFKLLYYSWLTWGYLGWRGLVAVFAFFWAAGLAQRLAVAPVARLVFGQERREGDLRFAHLRLREYAAEVAQYGAQRTERAHLDASLAAALANQRRLVSWRALLAGVTRTVDYCGAMLNYFVVGAAVFSGYAGSGDSGKLAQFISNSSFVLLSLIYTFTELLDLSDQLSRLGGLTARVGQLLEALPGSSDSSNSSSSGGSSGSSTDADGALAGGASGAASTYAAAHAARGMHAVRLSIDGREMQPSHFAALLQPPRMLSCLGGTVQLEVSVHQLGRDLAHEARGIFPDAPASGQLLACITSQFAAGGLSLAPDSSSATLERAAAEMDRMLDAFLRWQAAVRAFLAARGCWCNAVDPRRGTALHGPQGAKWSEVTAAHTLLGYERRDAGVCPVVLHPLHGSSAYPVTLFTDASPALLAQALAAVSGSPASAAAGGPGAAAAAAPSAGHAGAAPLLAFDAVSVPTMAGGLAVAGLNLALHSGEHLLIVGPNGCGKSTLVKALCGLHRLSSGSMNLEGALLASPAGLAGVIVVPQRPLAAPGSALWQQLCYPGADGTGTTNSSGGSGTGQNAPQQQAGRPADAHLLSLLRRVGLEYLLERVGGSFEAPADWAGMLSPGELQRLTVARVLHRRPSLAVLDEVTSAVSEQAATQLYGQLHAEGITCLSIGQDCQHLRRLHRVLLRLGGGPEPGSWQLERLE